MGVRDAAEDLSTYSEIGDGFADQVERSLNVEPAHPRTSVSKPLCPSSSKPAVHGPAARRPPHNIEAEQALLGAILVDNESLDQVSNFLYPDHFFDRLHARIYETLGTLIRAGKTATPITVKTFFENAAPITAGMTVPQYLRWLDANVTTTINAADYGRTIYDLATRRSLIDIGQDIVNAAYDSPVELSPAEQVNQLEQRITELRNGDETCFRIYASPYRRVAPEDIPPRPVMYGHEIRGLVGATVGRPGVGKTKLIISENLAKAAGRKLLHDIPTGRFKCWCWFGEEVQDDLDRLVTAAMRFHGLDQGDIAERLFISPREKKLIVAIHTRDGLIIAQPVVKAVKAFIRSYAIDCLTVDPFVKSHAAPENDNGVIDQVAGIWSEIAYETNCHIQLYHHTRKTGGAAITIDDVRGGSAIVGAVRSVRILNAMSEDDAARAGVEPPWAYIRIDDGKQNNLPPSKARWFHLKSIPLAHGDEAGVASQWEWPDPFAGIKLSDLLAVQKAVDAGRYRENVQAKDWVGRPIAKVLGLDATRDRKRIGTLIKTWIMNGSLIIIQGQDEHRRPKSYIEVGKWATE